MQLSTQQMKLCFSAKMLAIQSSGLKKLHTESMQALHFINAVLHQAMKLLYTHISHCLSNLHTTFPEKIQRMHEQQNPASHSSESYCFYSNLQTQKKLLVITQWHTICLMENQHGPNQKQQSFTRINTFKNLYARDLPNIWLSHYMYNGSDYNTNIICLTAQSTDSSPAIKYNQWLVNRHHTADCLVFLSSPFLLCVFSFQIPTRKNSWGVFVVFINSFVCCLDYMA